jgi:hypothetical protein
MTSGASPTLADAVRGALEKLENTPLDEGAVRLALVYAEAIDDDPAQLAKLGSGLLAVLESLAMTPRARAAVVGKGVSPRDDAPRSKLDQLRDRRAAREHPAAAVD